MEATGLSAQEPNEYLRQGEKQHGRGRGNACVTTAAVAFGRQHRGAQACPPLLVFSGDLHILTSAPQPRYLLQPSFPFHGEVVVG